MRTLLIVLLAASSTLVLGCRSRPIKTIMNGSMNMVGRMDMSGGMDMTGQLATAFRTDNTASRLSAVPVYRNVTSGGSVAVLDVDGLLVNKNMAGMGSMGENPVALFREKLDQLTREPSVKAIVLRINSPGGGVTACDIMLRDLLAVKQQRGVPVVACIMDVGAGGAYYLSTAADAVVAHPTSILGGLGVILNVYNLELTMNQVNIASIPVKAGEHVDMASPERMMEQVEREQLQAMADDLHQRLIDRITASRPSISAHADDIFSGKIMTGERAAELSLVDDLGYLDDAVGLARELAGLPADSSVVMLRRDNDRAYTLLDVTPNSPTMSSLIPLNVPGLDRQSLPTFLYMWQPESKLVAGN